MCTLFTHVPQSPKLHFVFKSHEGNWPGLYVDLVTLYMSDS